MATKIPTVVLWAMTQCCSLYHHVKTTRQYLTHCKFLSNINEIKKAITAQSVNKLAMSWVAQCFTSSSRTSNSLHTITNMFLGTAGASSSLSKAGQATSYVPKVKRHTALPLQPLQSPHTNKCCTMNTISCTYKNHDKIIEYLFKLIFKWYINRKANLQPGLRPATAEIHYQSGNPFTTTVTALLPVHWITDMVLCNTVPAQINMYCIFMHYTYHVWPALAKPHLGDEGVQKQWAAGVHSPHYCVHQTQSCWTPSVALFL